MRALILFLVLCFSVAFLGGRYQPGEWYAALSKPAWTPPGAVFAPVWTLLYIMMAFAAWFVTRQGGVIANWRPLAVFAGQLLLNALWSWFFFGLHRPGLALADIIVLWVAIGSTLILFWRVYPPSGILLLPYWLWVTFASALNFKIWRLNM